MTLLHLQSVGFQGVSLTVKLDNTVKTVCQQQYIFLTLTSTQSGKSINFRNKYYRYAIELSVKFTAF
jgi:hypothetical protein